MAQTDRTLGLVGNAAFKVPCKAVTTAAISLAGEQTVNGVVCETDDRVLVKNQVDQTENGIWVVDTGAWTRSQDFDGAYDTVAGTLVPIYNGVGTYAAYALTDEITEFGVDTIAFELVDSFLLAALLATSAGSSFIGFLQSGAGMAARTAQDKLRERRDARDSGTSTLESVALQTTKLQAALDALSSGQTINIDEAYNVTGVNLTNKTKIKVRGGGSINIVGGAAAAMALKLVGTCDRVEIEGLTFTGDANAAYTQQGIGNDSGQTLSRITVARCTFEGLNNGPGFNADSGGTYSRVICAENFIKGMLGTGGGQGYGIFNSKVTDIEITKNIIEDCERHSIYTARGSTTPGADTGVLIEGNIIRGHRRTINSATYRPAIFVARGYGAKIIGNKIIDYYDGAIGVAQDTTDGTSTGDIEIVSNTFSGRRNAVSTLLIGEQVNPTLYRLSNVEVRGNKFRSDIAVGGIQAEITIPNGLGVTVKQNEFHLANLTETAYRLIIVGENAPLGCKDIDNIVVKDNEVTATMAVGFDASAVLLRLVRVATTSCGANNLTLNTGYKWTASGSGTAEYYLELSAGGDPAIPQPFEVYDTAVRFTKGGTLGALATSTWGYGDNDALGYRTVYVRRAAGGDPDATTMTGDFGPRIMVKGNELDQNFAYQNMDYQATKLNKRIVEQFGNESIPGIYTDGETIPSLYGGVNLLQVTNSGATNLTSFRDFTPGQCVTLVFSDANTTVKHATVNIRLIGAADVVSAVRKTLVLQHNVAANSWYEISVAANS